MVFMLAVLFTAVRFGMWPAFYVSALSFLTFNFFFIEPRYTFTIAEPYELLALVIFLSSRSSASALAGRVREQARIAAHACARRAGCTNSRAGFRGSRRSSCRRRRRE